MSPPRRKRARQGRVVVLSGPSGVGKSTICREVVRRIDAYLSVSVTTRPRADSEQDGREYRFVSRPEFERRIRNDEFLEYAEVFGQYYGTPREPVERAVKEGRIVLLEIDVQGGRQVQRLYPDAVLIFVLPPSQKDLPGRMQQRGRGEDEATARRRLESAGQETAEAMRFYTNMVVNDDLEQAIQEVIRILQSDMGA